MGLGSWVGMRVLAALSSKSTPSEVVRWEFRVLIRLHSGVLMQVGTHPCAVAALILVRLESPSSFSRGVPWAELGEFSHNDHGSLLAGGTSGEIDAGELQHEILRGLLGDFGQSGVQPQKFSAPREVLLFGSVGEKPRVGAG